MSRPGNQNFPIDVARNLLSEQKPLHILYITIVSNMVFLIVMWKFHVDICKDIPKILDNLD